MLGLFNLGTQEIIVLAMLCLPVLAVVVVVIVLATRNKDRRDGD